jgi:hypothetical protein
LKNIDDASSYSFVWRRSYRNSSVFAFSGSDRWPLSQSARIPSSVFVRSDCDAMNFTASLSVGVHTSANRGENIASVEVEKAIAAHPAVAEVAVIGVPDDRWGEVPRAFVSLKPDASSPPSERDIIDWVRARLAHFKAPKSVVFLEALPQGGTGKIQKTQLREMEPDRWRRPGV